MPVGSSRPSSRSASVANPATAHRFISSSIPNGDFMSFEDKSITCVDCGAEFTFTADEQQRFAERGFTNEPKRCKTCRDAKKAAQGDSGSRGGYGGGGGGGRSFGGGGSSGGSRGGFSSCLRQM